MYVCMSWSSEGRHGQTGCIYIKILNSDIHEYISGDTRNILRNTEDI